MVTTQLSVPLHAPSQWSKSYSSCVRQSTRPEAPRVTCELAWKNALQLVNGGLLMAQLMPVGLLTILPNPPIVVVRRKKLVFACTTFDGAEHSPASQAATQKS